MCAIRSELYSIRQVLLHCVHTMVALNQLAAHHHLGPQACPRRRATIPACHAVSLSASDVSPTQEQELPSRMKRWVARKPGRSFRTVAELQEVELQPPGPGEVLVKMEWAGINGGCETFRARREFAFKQPEAQIPLGAEGAGTIVALGPGVRKLKVGQPVAVNASAAFSEYCVAKERVVTPVPGTAAGPEAAVLTLSGMTAIAALEGTAKIKAGQTVVVTAAAGGTGHLAVQLALLAGCHVVAVCGGKSKVEALQRLPHHSGSLVVIDHKTQDVAAQLRAVVSAGADVVYEGVGGSLRQQLLRCLAPGGLFLQVGYISEYPHACGYPSPQASPVQQQENQQQGAPLAVESSSWDEAVLQLPPAEQLFWSGMRLDGLPGGRRVTGQLWPKDGRTLLACKSRLWDLHYKQGLLDVWVDTSHGLTGIAHIPDAVDHMLKGQHLGKVVLRFDAV